MTSDAKIGLLLGLVFIFIIAFIINGLPKLRGQSDSNELTEIMMKNEHPGIGLAGSSDQVINAQPPVVEPEPVSPSPARQHTSYLQQQTDSQEPRVRHSQQMPIYSPLTGNSFRPEGFGRQTSFGPVRMHPDRTVTREPSAMTYKTTVRKPGEPERTVSIRPPKPIESKESVIIRPPKPIKPKTYTVTRGDSLGSIAKKFYGAVEGNKRANVAKIFEANKKLLKSPDKIKIGQELIIPSLPAKLPSPGLLSGSQFKRVNSIGKRTNTASTPKPKPVKTKSYTVKDGDSLWSISADLLGNGIRYREIAKLNKDVLPNEDDVRVGTKLKIPAM